MASQIRKIQLTGGSTYIVSVPKDWAKNLNLKPGDHVSISVQPDMSLLITPREVKPRQRESARVLIDVSTESKTAEEMAKEFIACYLAGYDIIQINFSQSLPKYRAYLKDIVRRRLAGVEIIEESISCLVAQCLLGYIEFPIANALNRMHVLALSMHKDAIVALKNEDKILAEEVVQRDDEVDRLYFFIVRQLGIAVRSESVLKEMGLPSARFCLSYRLTTKIIERIADHASRIAETVYSIDQLDPEIVGLVSKMSNKSNEVYEEAMKAFYELDIKMAHDAIAKSNEVVGMEDDVIKQILEAKLHINTIISLRLILESIRRIAEYGTDVAEIAINSAMEQNKRMDSDTAQQIDAKPHSYT
jgi:phosphate uptake regulator